MRGYVKEARLPQGLFIISQICRAETLPKQPEPQRLFV